MEIWNENRKCFKHSAGQRASAEREIELSVLTEGPQPDMSIWFLLPQKLPCPAEAFLCFHFTLQDLSEQDHDMNTYTETVHA